VELFKSSVCRFSGRGGDEMAIAGEANGEADDPAPVSKAEEHRRWPNVVECGSVAKRLAAA
jgi:hypothetical protein